MVDIRDWSRADTAQLLRAPGAADDKYSRGVVALRTGSPSYPGAAVLGVEAAWRTGAGYVRYVGDGRAADAVLARRPETVTGYDLGRTRVDCWVIGSGTDAAARDRDETEALRGILAGTAPVVVDAGAIDLAVAGSAPLLVTPHAREHERLRDMLDLAPSDSGDRAAEAAETARALGHPVLLKGSRTLIADPLGTVISVSSAPGWLATAGAGDVLAGILGALLASRPDASAVEIAAAGAWLHGHAATLASGAGRGAGHPIVALDVAEALPAAVGDLLS